MTLDAIHELIGDDFRSVDAVIRTQLHSDVALIDQLANYIILSGGKRLRPILVLLAARACGTEGIAHQTLAAVIEFIHTATLLHDDVVDASELRRGRETANAIWGNEATVLVGDFLYSRAFQMMVACDSMRVMEVLADTTNAIAEGEVLQLMNCNDPDTTEARYLDVIIRKTARLFEAGARVGAIAAGAPAEMEDALAEYGLELGIAFQLADDALDYAADSAAMGKNVGDDLAEGKPTLPLIRAMQEGSAEQRSLVRKAIEDGGLDNIEAIQAAIHETGALDYTLRCARDHAARARHALASLPDSPYRDAMAGLAEFAAARDH